MKGLWAAHKEIVRLIDVQEEFVSRCGRPKREVAEAETDGALAAAVKELAQERVREANRTPVKEDRDGALGDIVADVQERLAEDFPESEGAIAEEVSALVKADMREMMKTHLDATLVEATDTLQGKYVESVRAYDDVHKQILEMADMLSDGIMRQFPSRFR